MADIKTLIADLRRAAEEIRAERHNGWGNTCAAAADALDALAEAHQAEVARLTRENEGLAKDAARYRALKYAPTEQIRDLIVAAPGRWDEMADTARASTDEGVGK